MVKNQRHRDKLIRPLRFAIAAPIFRSARASIKRAALFRPATYRPALGEDTCSGEQAAYRRRSSLMPCFQAICISQHFRRPRRICRGEAVDDFAVADDLRCRYIAPRHGGAVCTR